MKKVLLYIVFLLSIFIFKSSVYANTIKSVDMNIYIDEYGNGIVKEVWNTSLTKGTEGYKTFSKLNGSKITDLKVSDDTGREYRFRPFGWNTSESFEEKAYSYGYNYNNDTTEICWGISSYGNRTYTIEYKITNLVKQYKDVQGIYFNFLNNNQDVERVNVYISSYVPLSLDNARIWGLGYDGSISFTNDGFIYLSAPNGIDTSHYVVGLVRFQESLYNLSVKLDKTFDDEYDNAFAEYKKSQSSIHKFWNTTKNLFSKIWSAFRFLLVPIAAVVMLLIFGKPRGIYKHNYNNMKDINSENANKDIDNPEYFRDIPCNKDIPVAYWICYQYGIVPENDLRKGIIGAYFTKWIYDGKLKMIKNDNIFDKYSMDISNMEQNSFDSEIENTLAGFLIKAANGNKIINARDFYNWSKDNFHSFDYMYNRIFGVAKQKLSEQGLLYKTKSDDDSVNNQASTSYFNVKVVAADTVSDEVNNEALRLKGLKKFLIDFGNVADKGFFEVHTFKDYIVFANLLGVADKVEKQFKDLYPDYYFKYEYDLDLISDFCGNIFKYYSNGHDSYVRHHNLVNDGSSIFDGFGDGSHDYSGSSSISGGGGGSFSVGGGSSGGSSGGGFR